MFFHIWIILYTLTWEESWQESWQRRCSSGNKDLLTLILSYVFCVNPTSGWWFIKEVNMESLVSTTAPHLLSGERLRNNHTGPPRMAFHLAPNQSASAKYGWRFSAGEKQWSLWDIHSNKARAKSHIHLKYDTKILSGSLIRRNKTIFRKLKKFVYNKFIVTLLKLIDF